MQRSLLLILIILLVSCTAKVEVKEETKTAKNIILFIGDGMGVSQVSASHFFKKGQVNFDRFNRIDLTPDPSGKCTTAPLIGPIRSRDWAYLAVAVPGIIVGGAQLGQVILTQVFGIPVVWIGMAGVTLGLLIWATSDLQAMTNSQDDPITRMAEETSFITVWVIGAYLLYDYLAAYAGFDLQALFQSVGPLLPLIAIVVGFIPGCGPQVLVTTLYINGIIPFAAVVGNAISNDGDALFPAIALNPRAAVVATAYSSIPAVIVAYGFYFLAPGFMN